MTNLSILSKEIRILDGLYSLNDLHKASGAAKKHQPSLFMHNQTTRELVAEIDNESDLGIPRSVITKRGGRDRGTWVCKDLVYFYAMWISPKFSLKVIRAFDAMNTQQPAIEHKNKFCMDEKDVMHLVWIWFAAEQMRQTLGWLEPALRGLGSSFVGTVYSQHREYKHTARQTRKTLLKVTKDIHHKQHNRHYCALEQLLKNFSAL